MRKMLKTIISSKELTRNEDGTITAVKPKRDIFDEVIAIVYPIMRKSARITIIVRKILTPWFSKNRKIVGILSDQSLIGRYIATKPDKINIKLDYECRLFWTCAPLELERIDKHYEMSDNSIMNKNTGNVPSFIHVTWATRYKHILRKFYKLIMNKAK